MKNRSTNGIKMGRDLGIDLSWILVDFWKQVGRENGTKIGPKRHRKNDGKMEGTKIAKHRNKTFQPRGTERVQGPGEGVRGRGNPLPEERGEVV